MDQSNSYFFEATQMGPPRLFSKIQMMIIISRMLEEMGNDSEDNENAYRIVYEHMIMEGHIDEDFEYDDWISDSLTWLDLADRCAAHDMYSLATDFYALGILKDPTAFKKPMLWYRFAKSCMRCGRKKDAHLSIGQALTTAPHNLQLLRAKHYWIHGNLKSQQYNFPLLMQAVRVKSIRIICNNI